MDTSKNDNQNKNQLLCKKRNLAAKLKTDIVNLSKIDIEKENKIKLIESEFKSKKKKKNEEFEKHKEEYFQIIKLEER